MARTIHRALSTLLILSIPLFSFANDTYDRDVIQARLEAMDCIVKPLYTPVVENYIKGYFRNNGFKARAILARTVTYFPIFEKYLADHDMPDDLKYLAVLESALRPDAVSRVGATGLWQFMEETGSGYGLKINSKIDERSCPNRSTMAAMEYMNSAYERFGNWELAIASYNCGAGNIRKAIQRSGGRTDYWTISKYLPRETRNFVPAFLGAAYMIKYHHLHGVAPEYHHLDMQLTESELIFNELTFETIAAITGLPISVVEQLNPAYKKAYVPADQEGHWVVLPRRTMQALRDYNHLSRPDNGISNSLPELPTILEEDQYHPEQYYYKTYYSALAEDELPQLGKIFGCSAYNLKVWNHLTSDRITAGQELLVWFPRELKRYQPFSQKVDILPSRTGIPKKAMGIQRAKIHAEPIDAVELAPIPLESIPQLPALPLSDANGTPKTGRPGIEKIKNWVGGLQLGKKEDKTDPVYNYH